MNFIRWSGTRKCSCLGWGRSRNVSWKLRHWGLSYPANLPSISYRRNRCSQNHTQNRLYWSLLRIARTMGIWSVVDDVRRANGCDQGNALLNSIPNVACRFAHQLPICVSRKSILVQWCPLQKTCTSLASPMNNRKNHISTLCTYTKSR